MQRVSSPSWRRIASASPPVARGARSSLHRRRSAFEAGALIGASCAMTQTCGSSTPMPTALPARLAISAPPRSPESPLGEPTPRVASSVIYAASPIGQLLWPPKPVRRWLAEARLGSPSASRGACLARCWWQPRKRLFPCYCAPISDSVSRSLQTDYSRCFSGLLGRITSSPTAFDTVTPSSPSPRRANAPTRRCGSSGRARFRDPMR
jgi:hypothetical protein